MRFRTRVRGLLSLVRNLLLAALLYVCIFAVAEAIRWRAAGSAPQPLDDPVFEPFHWEPPPQEETQQPLENITEPVGPKIVQTSHDGLLVKFPGLDMPVTINPYANSFNRPKTLVRHNDAFLGKRPHVDIEAYYPKIVDTCRGNYYKAQRMGMLAHCLHYLTYNPGDYLRLPSERKRASQQDPRRAEYHDADGANNTLSSYARPADAQPPSRDSKGTCAGPIIPYHTYWNGPVTWRLELFIKSYLFTQNLPCSRLFVWLDEDQTPGLLNATIAKNPVFQKFLPLVARGDVALRSWKFPRRIPMPPDDDNTDGRGFPAKRPQLTDRSEVDLGHGIALDLKGQQWLTLSTKQLSLLPVPPVEAIRWITLHLHGGVFLDPDVMMMRDMRPLLIYRNHTFAQRWGSRAPLGEYSTSVVSLTANSSLSAYFVRGGVRMSMNFHPLVLGMMAVKDGMNEKMTMFENTLFDPLWKDQGQFIQGKCPVPCFDGDETRIFRGRNTSVPNEWRGHSGETFKRKHLQPMTEQVAFRNLRRVKRMLVDAGDARARTQQGITETEATNDPGVGDTSQQDFDSSHLPANISQADVLRHHGIVLPYDPDEDAYPPTNRTLENFFRGAYTYKIHGQWDRHPEPSSWLDIIKTVHDGFFDGQRTNPYGETWKGPAVDRYSLWPEYL